MCPQAVLVVDDEPTMRFCLHRLLTARGFEVATAADASTALGSVQETTPDAVVLDVVLEDTDGCRLCAELRHACADKDLKILMVSARSGPDDVEKGLAAGADGYLAKPFAAGALLERLTTLLDAR